MAIDFLWDIRAASKINAQEEKLEQPDPGQDEIKTKRKRGITVGYIAELLVLGLSSSLCMK